MRTRTSYPRRRKNLCCHTTVVSYDLISTEDCVVSRHTCVVENDIFSLLWNYFCCHTTHSRNHGLMAPTIYSLSLGHYWHHRRAICPPQCFLFFPSPGAIIGIVGGALIEFNQSGCLLVFLSGCLLVWRMINPVDSSPGDFVPWLISVCVRPCASVLRRARRK